MKRIVGVRFKKAGRVYYFNPGELVIEQGDGVIVETTRGVEYAEAVLPPRDLPEEQIVAPLKDVLRVATHEDVEIYERNLQLEEEAFEICQKKIAERELDMKLVNVEYTFNASKITFFFTSEGRVDFRDLVKDLASIFKTRIELRQIGVRDEAKMLGGLGSCGLPVCCKTFLADFQPVSIKMAKEQKLSLSPTKISGLCGRLMCCLKYEQDSYESMRKQMPRVNREVITVDGKGMVLDNNVITERTRVRITLQDGTLDVREYHFSDVLKPGAPEEEEGQRQELLARAREKAAQKTPPKEDVFRFVTGAAVEGPPEMHGQEENGQLAGRQPVDRQSTDRQSTDRQPAGRQPGERRQADRPAAGRKKPGSHAGGGQPRGGQSKGNRPNGNQPNGSQPSGSQPNGRQPNGNQSGPARQGQKQQSQKKSQEGQSRPRDIQGKPRDGQAGPHDTQGTSPNGQAAAKPRRNHRGGRNRKRKSPQGAPAQQAPQSVNKE